MEASALTHASRRGLLARRSPLLKLQGDEKLIAMVRSGNAGAFETIVDRYQGRLLGFCRQMLGSTEDAEDVLQEVFVNAYRAMLADEREINLRPWLYRIARNRCLNHLRKPTADAQESMDMVPAVEAASTAEKVHNREEFRQIISDVNKLPETQRSALLLREMEALSYEEIAAAMDTTVPSVKSLLVRARISLAEASQARLLTCGEVRVELSEAAEGLTKVSAPVRRHVRECDECADFRKQIRSNEKMLAALFPIGPLIAFKGFIASKLGLGGASAGSGAAAGARRRAGAGAAGGRRGQRRRCRARRRRRRAGRHRRDRRRDRHQGGRRCRHRRGPHRRRGRGQAERDHPGQSGPVPQRLAPPRPAAGSVGRRRSIAVARPTNVLPKENVEAAVAAQAPVAGREPQTPPKRRPNRDRPGRRSRPTPVAAEDAEEAAGQSTAADGTGGIDSATEGITDGDPSTGVTPGAHPATGTVVVTVGGTAGDARRRPRRPRPPPRRSPPPAAARRRESPAAPTDAPARRRGTVARPAKPSRSASGRPAPLATVCELPGLRGRPPARRSAPRPRP